VPLKPLHAITLAIASLTAVSNACAFPDKPITLIVPYPPGGATVVVGRILAKALGTKLGQTVIVDNKVGAGTAIGAAALA
jgi:tripartite-type tricarboxylate transporter receptor subunit TctC